MKRVCSIALSCAIISALQSPSAKAIANVPVPIAWTDYFNPITSGGDVKTLATNGTVTTVWDGSSRVEGITFDNASNQVYWTDLGSGDVVTTGYIRSANLDGSNLSTALTWNATGGSQVSISSVQLDVPHDTMYWVDETDYGHPVYIRTASLTGGNATTILQAPDRPADLALDLPAGKMFWSDFAGDELWSANLNGSDPTELISNLYTSDVAVDTLTNKLYVTGRTPPGNVGPYSYYLMTCNLDGSSATTLFTSGLNDPRGMALDPDLGIGFVADLGSNRILEFNLDGSGPLTPVATGLNEPIDVTIVPEPGACGLSAVGALLALARRRRNCAGS